MVAQVLALQLVSNVKQQPADAHAAHDMQLPRVRTRHQTIAADSEDSSVQAVSSTRGRRGGVRHGHDDVAWLQRAACRPHRAQLAYPTAACVE